MDEFVLPPNSELLFEANRGVYIPQHFAQEIERDRVTGVSADDYAILENGPNADNEPYWDVWHSVLDNARLTDADGTEFFLYQDGDVWAVSCNVPAYDEENMERLVEYVANNTDEEELRGEFAESRYDLYRQEPDMFFQDAEAFPEAFEDSEYAEITNYVDSIQRYLARKAMPGHFLTRVLENDLSGAMAHADLTSQRLLPVIVKYVYNHIPAGAWGSKGAVQRWWSMR